MKIAFIGNCQLVSLCYFVQLLTRDNPDIDARWCCFADWFIQHLGPWSSKCINKIIDPTQSTGFISDADIVVCNIICKQTSPLFNYASLLAMVKPTCRIIAIPSMYLSTDKYDESVVELKRREAEMPCNFIPISDICDLHRDKQLALTVLHPTSFFFMEVMKKLCPLLDIQFFSNDEYNNIVKDINFMNLP